MLGTLTEHHRTHRRAVGELVPLGEIPDPHPARTRDPPRVRLDPPGEQGYQGGLTVTVTADDADPVPGSDPERDTLEQRNRPVRLAETFNIDEIHNASKAIRPGYALETATGACG
jgi:hypothetical protein